jgi:hypothetical protein
MGPLLAGVTVGFGVRDSYGPSQSGLSSHVTS